MPKAKPVTVSFTPSDSQLLWKKDPRLKGLTFSKARTAVNQYIRSLVIDLAGNPPNCAPPSPHHRNHPVSRPQIAVGQNNYRKIGSYYVLCFPISDSDCLKNTKYVTLPFVEEFIMLHDELTPLLLMREELQPKPTRSATLNIQQARTTIVHSPLYNKAVQMFYSDTPTSATYLPSPRTPPINACPQALPTPPQTIQRAGPSHKLEHLASKSLNDASDHSDGSSATPPPFILPHPPVQQHVNSSYQLDPDSSDDSEAVAEDPRLEIEADSEVIVIDSDSDQETLPVTVPFLLVFWTMNNSSSTERLFYCEQGSSFCLKTFEFALKSGGISLVPRIENYNPTTEKWDSICLKDRIGPLFVGDGKLKVFLLRYEGIEHLSGFRIIAPLANQLPRGKGKERAF